MSLKDLAQQMKATGRKGDTELVHMTKREVAGLQALAEAAGGTLTTNPKTGLPEASFLERLLPSIIGLGVGMFAGPMAGAAAGALVGGATNEENPMMGALMGGLGGYGGATLGAGLNTAGSAAAQGAQGTAANLAAEQAMKEAAAQGTQQFAAQQAAQQGAGLMSTGVDAGFVNAMRPDILAQAAPTSYQQALIQSSPEVIGAGNRAAAAVYDAAAKDFAAQPFLSRAGQGIQALGDAGGRTAFMQDVGGLGGLAKAGGMGLAPMLMAGPRTEMPTEKEEDDEDLFRRYEYRANPTGGIRRPGSAFTSERTYFQPEYRRMFAAKGGEVKKYAEGGEAAASSDAMADPARGMTGMSRDAMLYLYGMAPAEAAAPETEYVAPEIKFEPSRFKEPKKSSRLSGLFGFGQQPVQQYDIFGNPIGGYGTSYSGLGGGGFGSNMNFGGWGSGAAAGGEVRPEGFADGGIAALARGGMKAGGFVVPADVVSMVGEGNTDAGYDRIKRMIPGATPIKGKDGGQADTVATSIEGKQPARIAHGEMYVPPAAVKRAGGAKKLYAMMKNVRKQAKGDTKQIKPVNLKKAMA